MTCAPRSAADIFAMDPPNLPTPVRTAAVMTTSFIHYPPDKVRIFDAIQPQDAATLALQRLRITFAIRTLRGHRRAARSRPRQSPSQAERLSPAWSVEP